MALPANWRVAESIRQLHRQLRPFAATAPATTFGTVADPDHDSASDHFPKRYTALGTRPVVTAGDFPDGYGLDATGVLDSIRASRDPRVKYGISDGRMFSSYPAHGYPPWTWRPYSGSDGHFTHGHLSVVGDARADDPRPWQIGPATSSPQGDLMALTNEQLQDIWLMAYRLSTLDGGPRTDDRWNKNLPNPGIGLLKNLETALAASAQREQDMISAITTLAAGGTSVDTAAVIAAINARSTDLTGLLQQQTGVLQQQAERIAALETELAEQHERQAEAAQAAADALAEDGT